MPAEPLTKRMLPSAPTGATISLLTVLSGRNGTLVIRLLSWPPWKMKIPPARVGSTTVRVSRTADTLVVGMPP